MEFNPYSSPEANVGQTPQGSVAGEVSAAVLAQLEGTKRWVRVVAVFLWIAVGLMVLGGLAVGSGSSFMPSENDGLNLIMGLGMAAFYLVLAALYVVPARQLWSYGSRIDRCLLSRSMDDLVSALDAQRGFWKFVGIGFLVMVGLYGLGFVGVILFTFLGGSL